MIINQHSKLYLCFSGEYGTHFGLLLIKLEFRLILTGEITLKQKNMFNKIMVREALKRSQTLQDRNGEIPAFNENENDTLISLLIHDIFGGEILKTRRENGWHFYNRIDGVRIDFIHPEKDITVDEKKLEDIPSTPEETHDYFEEVDYSTFFMRFVGAYEETVGLHLN